MTITKRIEKFINETAAIDASINGFDLQDSIKEITEQIVTDDYSNCVNFAYLHNVAIPVVLRHAIENPLKSL